MDRKRSRKNIAEMPIPKRLSLAKEKVKWMVDELIILIELHENNALITYSPILSDQIPRSHAARAFNVVQASIQRYEIIRLCTFWDGVDLDKASIPTVVELVDHPRISDLVAKDFIEHWGNIGFHMDTDPDPAIQAQIEATVRANEVEFGRQEGTKAVQRLAEAIKVARKTEKSSKLKSTQSARHKFAHRLKATSEELQNPGTVAAMKYGDERDLLEETIEIIDGLYLSINGTSFSWKDSRRIAENNSRALWEGCTFKVLR